MRVRSALALVSFLAVLGCKKIPLKPAKPLPAGTVEFRFTRKVKGPLDLSIDGTRIPVVQAKSGGKMLHIEGLTPGKHILFMSSPREAFGPDQTEVVLPDDGGFYQVVFSQRFEGVLYGKAPETPAAEGLPGVKATLRSN
jgi:hypothetical protein